MASAPNHKGSFELAKTSYKGLKKGPRLHQDDPSTNERAPDNQRLKIPNPSKLTGIFRKTAAPNIDGDKRKKSKGMVGLGKGLTSYNNQEKCMENPELADRTQTDSQGAGDRTTKEISKQLTLCRTLQPDLMQLEQDEGKYGILTHGPPCQGPRNLLIIHEEHQERAGRWAARQIEQQEIKLSLFLDYWVSFHCTCTAREPLRQKYHIMTVVHIRSLYKGMLYDVDLSFQSSIKVQNSF